MGEGGRVGVRGSCANYTQEYVDRMLKLLAGSVTTLEAKGLLDHAYVYGFDECPISCEPQVRKLFGAIKAQWPSLKTSAVLNWSPMPPDLPLDVWILQYQEFVPADAEAWHKAGGLMWLYHCIEPHSLRYLNTFIERPAIQGRLLFWNAARLELTFGNPTGWLYYAVNLWKPCNSAKCGGAHSPKILERVSIQTTANNANVTLHDTAFTDFPPANYVWLGAYDDIFVNGDGQYYYPCEGGHPCPTLRLAAIRDGLEDWELFRHIKNKTAAAAVVAQIVRGADDWAIDPCAVESARRAAIHMLEEEQSLTI